MATQGAKSGHTVALGWTNAASGNVVGGTAIGIGHDHVGGTAAMSSGLQLEQIADNRGAAFGSVVVSNDGTEGATTDSAGVGKALSAGTLAFNPNALDKRDDRSETWIMRGVTTKLSDVDNTALHSRGTVGDGRYDNIHGTVGDRHIGSGDATFDVTAAPSTQIVPGRTKGSLAGKANNFQNTTDTTVAVDSEVFPTRSVPGELTYHFGGLGRPTTDEYKAKNSNE